MATRCSGTAVLLLRYDSVAVQAVVTVFRLGLLVVLLEVASGGEPVLRQRNLISVMAARVQVAGHSLELQRVMFSGVERAILSQAHAVELLATGAAEVHGVSRDTLMTVMRTDRTGDLTVVIEVRATGVAIAPAAQAGRDGPSLREEGMQLGCKPGVPESTCSTWSGERPSRFATSAAVCAPGASASATWRDRGARLSGSGA